LLLTFQKPAECTYQKAYTFIYKKASVSQGDAVQEDWLFEPAAEEKYRALKLEAADVMKELAEDEVAAPNSNP